LVNRSQPIPPLRFKLSSMSMSFEQVGLYTIRAVELLGGLLSIPGFVTFAGGSPGKISLGTVPVLSLFFVLERLPCRRSSSPFSRAERGPAHPRQPIFRFFCGDAAARVPLYLIFLGVFFATGSKGSAPAGGGFSRSPNPGLAPAGHSMYVECGRWENVLLSFPFPS